MGALWSNSTVPPPYHLPSAPRPGTLSLALYRMSCDADGRTLARVVDASEATLVVLDAEAFALSRLWCLYEIGTTPLHKLELLTDQAATAQVVAAARQVDAATAMCFSDDDRRMIT